MSVRICRILGTGVLLLPLLTASCSSRKYDGKWEGMTSQGGVLAFTVKDGVITKTRIEFELKCERSGFCPVHRSTEQDLSAKISGGSFSATIDKTTFAGKFDSNAKATGELKTEEPNTPCGTCSANITWTAENV